MSNNGTMEIIKNLKNQDPFTKKIAMEFLMQQAIQCAKSETDKEFAKDCNKEITKIINKSTETDLIKIRRLIEQDKVTLEQEQRTALSKKSVDNNYASSITACTNLISKLNHRLTALKSQEK